MERIIKLSSPQELALVEEFYDIRRKYQEHHLFLTEKFERESVEALEIFTQKTRKVSQRIFEIVGEDLSVLDDTTKAITLLNRFVEHGNAYLCIDERFDPEHPEKLEVEYEAVDHSDELNTKEKMH